MKVKKEQLNVSTYDLQDLVIALISYKPDSVITKADKERLIGTLTDLNNLCSASNDYTLRVTVQC